MPKVHAFGGFMKRQHGSTTCSLFLVDAHEKVIQTEVDPVVYSFVLKTAEAKGLTLKEAARQALTEWAAREGDLSWDPLFDLSKTFTAGHRTDVSEVNEVVYRRRKR